jgi:hypothetical protein
MKDHYESSVDEYGIKTLPINESQLFSNTRYLDISSVSFSSRKLPVSVAFKIL